MKWIISLFIAAIATSGFAVQFNAPKRTLIPASLGGGISWVIYDSVLDSGSNFILAGFIAAFIVGTIGEFSARKFHCPATLFILPGLIPLVPGAGMYYTMSHLIEQNYELFTKTSVETFFTAASLSVGVVASSVFSKSLKGFKVKKHNIHKHR
ncbi:MAG: threonine/serine exporter family protein [Tissierellia bacterium]|nr:threonine/serine exporter family protein [Tissierellia bacterium]